MNASEWNFCHDPEAMLSFIQRWGDARKLVLFGVACCRRAQGLSTHPDHRALMDETDAGRGLASLCFAKAALLKFVKNPQ